VSGGNKGRAGGGGGRVVGPQCTIESARFGRARLAGEKTGCISKVISDHFGARGVYMGYLAYKKHPARRTLQFPYASRDLW